MNHSEYYDLIASVLCSKPNGVSVEECFNKNEMGEGICGNYGKCRIWEKNFEQLGYIAHPQDKNSFLKACAGSGKTEVVGLKAAYEIKRWVSNYSGVAILTFTNNAADVIQERISQSAKLGYPHFVGTFDSWLHRYIANPFSHIITKYKGVDGDRSIRIVDNRSASDFLFAYQTKYNYFETPTIKANEYSFNLSDGSFVFSSNDENVDRIRNRSILVEWQKTELSELKKRFWLAGFLTYQDVEFVCYKLLLNHLSAAEIISKRFPLILVDECQDLAWSQIQILEQLLLKGSQIHLIGDLNQSIYSFRRVDPSDVTDFVERHKFVDLKLTQNFRSVQPIVDLTSKLVNQGRIQGLDMPSDKLACVYFEYKAPELHNLPNYVTDYLFRNKFEIEKCAILARSNNTVAKLRPGVKNDFKIPVLLPAALQLWALIDMTPDQVNEALSSVGRFVSSNYFGNQLNNRQKQYCPEGIKSAVVWRLFLSEILNRCVNEKDLSNLELDWASWAKKFREKFLSIFSSCAEKYDISLDPSSYKDYRSPLGKGGKALSKEKVRKTLEMVKGNSSRQIRITNFHQIKGETLDAAVVVSSPTYSGEGYWKNWLKDTTSESARFAYVASSRPSFLLIWAVPEGLADKDIETLMNLGFMKSNL